MYTWPELIGFMILARNECSKRDLRGLFTYDPPGSQPPSGALESAEDRLGQKLPPALREFYTFCNGWPNFSQDISVVSLDYLGSKTLVERLLLVEDTLLSVGSTEIIPGVSTRDCYVFGYGEDDEATYLVVGESVDTRGTIIKWWSEDYEVFADFREFFMASIEYTNLYFTA
jgi:hypothetical protein